MPATYRKLSDLAQGLKPYILKYIEGTQGGAGNAVNTPVDPISACHGGLLGLSDDDHGGVYPAIGQDETITGSWTFPRLYIQDDLGIGASPSGAYRLEVSGSALINNNLYLGIGMYHYNDTDTYLAFSDDAILFYAGGVNLLGLYETTQDQVLINGSGSDVDFRVNNNAGNATIFAEGSSGWIAFGAATSPSALLDARDDTKQMRLTYASDTSKYADLHVGSTGTLEIDAVSDIVLDPAGNQVSPGGHVQDDLGNYNAAWRTLYASELYVENLVAQDVLATIGGRIMVAPTTKLSASVATGDTSIQVEDNNLLAQNDFILLKTAPGGVPQVEAMQLTSGSSGTSGSVIYSVSRDEDGSGANEWLVGDAVVNLGYTAGEGYIELTSTQTIHSELGPTIALYSRDGTTNWDDVAPVTVIGKLDSYLGYSEVYGFAIGNDLSLGAPTSNSFQGATLTNSEGLRLYNTDLKLYDSSTPKVQIEADQGIYVSSGTLGVETTVFATVFADSASLASLDAGDLIVGTPFSAGTARGIHWDNSACRLNIYGGVYIGANDSFVLADHTFEQSGCTLGAGDLFIGDASGASAGAWLWYDYSGGDLWMGTDTTKRLGFDSSQGTFWFGSGSVLERFEWTSACGVRIMSASNTPVMKFPTSGSAQITGVLDIINPGSLTAGTGAVVLDSDGVSIAAGQASINKLSFSTASTTISSADYFYHAAENEGHRYTITSDQNASPINVYHEIDVIQGSNISTTIFEIDRIRMYRTPNEIDLYVDGGINLGTAQNPTPGDIIYGGDIKKDPLDGSASSTGYIFVPVESPLTTACWLDQTFVDSTGSINLVDEFGVTDYTRAVAVTLGAQDTATFGWVGVGPSSASRTAVMAWSSGSSLWNVVSGICPVEFRGAGSPVIHWQANANGTLTLSMRIWGYFI